MTNPRLLSYTNLVNNFESELKMDILCLGPNTYQNHESYHHCDLQSR
jgi:hypothetical protein